MPHISVRFKLLIGMSFELDKLRLGSLSGHFQDSGPWFGLGQEQQWDPVLAVFFADRISYPVWEDQASFERVQSLLQVYSEGFEVGFFSGSDGLYLPYGYTGYYPIARTSFEELKSQPECWKTRSIAVQPGERYFCLFNYSVAPSFYKTHFSYLLMQRYIKRIKKLRASGLVAFVVSEEGGKFAERVFGLKEVGILGSEHGERVFAGSFSS